MTRQLLVARAAMLAILTTAVLLLLSPAHAQSTQPVQVQPDCSVSVNISAVGRYPANVNSGYDNRLKGCVTWAISYTSTGFTALSLELDSADTVAGVPGTWGAFSGSIVDGNAAGALAGPGVNPNTDTEWAWTMEKGNPAWVSLNLTSKTGTGTISANLYGWRSTSTVTTGGGGGLAANVTIVGPLGQALMAASLPVAIASNQSAVPENLSQLGGSSIFPCLSAANITLSASGNTEIIAASGSTVIRICGIYFSTATPENIKLTRGTGTNCGSGTADLTGTFQQITGLAISPGPFSPITGTASNAVCVNQTGTQAAGGVVLYDQR